MAEKKSAHIQKQQQAMQRVAAKKASPAAVVTPTSILMQRAKRNPASLNPSEVLQLQRQIGNQAVLQLQKRQTGVIQGVFRSPDKVDRARADGKLRTTNIEKNAFTKATDDLACRHTSKELIWFAGTAVDGRMEAANAQHWYRALSESEFTELFNSNRLSQGDYFGGVATNRTYVKNTYLNNNSSAFCIVEFDVPNFYQDAHQNGVNIKGEGDGGSFGLGKKGTQDKRAKKKGEKNKNDSGQVPAFDLNKLFFDNMTNWRLVDIRILNKHVEGYD